jgi:hypothetical protein
VKREGGGWKEERGKRGGLRVESRKCKEERRKRKEG